MTNEKLTLPSPESVEVAWEKFNSGMIQPDPTLFKLFEQYPMNTDPSEVLLKVVALNSLYSTLIRVNTSYLPTDKKYAPTVYDVTKRILDCKIDDGLSRGDIAVVLKIETIKIAEKYHYFYSFATKYCSFHQPEHYPIFDSRVKEYLWRLRNEGGLHKFQQQELWDYTKLKGIIDELMNRYGLDNCSYKKIDAFMYLEGGKLLA